MAFNVTFSSQENLNVSFRNRNQMDADFSPGGGGLSSTFNPPQSMGADFNESNPMSADFKVGSMRLPPGGLPGDLLAKKTEKDGDAEWITPADKVEEDNTKPITSAAVYTEIGNINALLASI